MSNSRSHRRSLEAARAGKPTHSRVLSDEELELLGSAWSGLTDETIETIGPDREPRADLGEWLGREIEKLSERYGTGAVAGGAVSSCTQLASHILEHEPVVGELTGMIEQAPWLSTPGEKAAAERLALAILAAAAGMPGADARCLGELLSESADDAVAASLGVWMLFCTLGATVGIGLDFCDAPTLDLDALGELDAPDGADEAAEDLEMLLGIAPDAAGLAAGLVAAVRAGDRTTTLALARSVSAFGAEEETAACLGLLGASDDSGAALGLAASGAVGAVRDAADEDDDDADELIGAALGSLADRALAAGPGRSTSQVLAEVERRIELVRSVLR